MARKKIERQDTLAELIPLYGEQNAECNTLKKTVADLNKRIKDAIHAVNKENTDIEIDGWRVTLSVSDNSTFNEDKLIEFAKANNIKIVKKKEYIDYDALESLIYNGKIDKDTLLEMDSCKETTSKETLRCTRIKEA